MMFETGSGRGGQAPMAMEVQIPVLKMRMVRDIQHFVSLVIALEYYCYGQLESFLHVDWYLRLYYTYK